MRTERKFVPKDARSLLLVSVRSAEEAAAALAGGADIIDVKEPARGPLGAADADTIAEVVRTVGGRVPVTASLGEFVDNIARISCSGETRHHPRRPQPSVSLWKMALAGCADLTDWQAKWIDAAEPVGGGSQLAAVIYADWRAARAPRPDDILAAAIELGCPVVLVDTWDKSAGSLSKHWPLDTIHEFVDRVHASGRRIALAGSLSLPDVRALSAINADVIAVRGAACVGGREGVVSQARVGELLEALGSEQTAVAAASSSSFPHS